MDKRIAITLACALGTSTAGSCAGTTAESATSSTQGGEGETGSMTSTGGGATGGGSQGTAGAAGTGDAAGTGTAGAGAGGASSGSCKDVSGDYGDCQTVLGWGFDGTECKLFSGCDCGPSCGSFFPDAVACASACAAAGQCDTAAMKAAYLAQEPFVPGNHCDGVYICTPDASSSLVEALFPGIVCENSGTPCPPDKSCTAYYSGTVTEPQWTSLCAASLLPKIESIYCIIYGP